MFLFCDPDRTQTCDLQNRNLTFYSLNYGAGLQLQSYGKFCKLPNFYH